MTRRTKPTAAAAGPATKGGGVMDGKTLRWNSKRWRQACDAAFGDWKEWTDDGVCMCRPDHPCVWADGSSAYVALVTEREES